MYKILNELSNKSVIERSKFLSFIYHCDSTKKQGDILKYIKSLHPSASHVCYASAIFDGKEILYYSSDDGEPSGTAGLQILNVLKENDLIDCMCVVVRFFGGIKLGVPGLSRAYKNSAQQVVVDNKKECQKKLLYEINCTYEQYNILSKFFLKNHIKPTDTKFNNSIYILVALSNDEYDKMSKISSDIQIKDERAFYN